MMYISSMKIYFFGTPEFAVPTLKILASSKEFKILAVVTRPDKEGNRKILTEPPVKKAAKDLGLKIFQPEKIDEKLIEEIRKNRPDAIVVVAYGELIPSKLLDIAKYGCINVHPSLLPKYRGASPIQEALLNGDEETGIAIMKLDEKLDHGPIFFIKRVAISPSDNFQTLSKRLSETSAIILPMVLKDIENEILTPIKQSDKNSSYCREISKKEGEIDWNLSSEKILNKIRALNPWPSTYTDLKGKKLKILEASSQKAEKKTKPGEIVVLDKNSFGFSTKDGIIVPSIVQLEGKAETSAKEFMNGHRSSLL